jgi:hypothetical protein
MLIRREILERIKAGEITLQFRRWRRRTVKPGGTLKTRVGVLRIGAIAPVRPEEVTDADARAAGFAGAADFRAWLDTMKPGELDRIEVSYLGEDPRARLRDSSDLSEPELAEIADRLDELDRRAEIGAWTGRAMDLIARHPGRLAEALAGEMGLAKHPFKARIRKLKELGLTESLEVGYRLSPRGERVRAFCEGRRGGA